MEASEFNIYEKCDDIVYCTSNDYEFGDYSIGNCPSPCDPDGTATYQRYKKENITCVGDDYITESCLACEECTYADYEQCPTHCGYTGGDAILKSGRIRCTEPSTKKQCPPTPSCESTCRYGSWGDWVPSTDKACGTNVPQERTRSITKGDSSYCTEKLKEDTTTRSVPCPCPINTAGYTTLDNKQYRYYNTSKKWTEASEQCRSDGAKLITVKNADDKRLLDEMQSS